MSMAYPIQDIEGIGVTYGEKLEALGIRTTDDLLKVAGSKKGRVQLAEHSGLSESLILTWVNHADLFRIKGVAGQFAELLEAAGVDSVREFATRNPENLHQKLLATNDQYGLSGRVPSVDELKGMIAQAATLAPAVSH